MKPKRPDRQQLWAEARPRCRLSDEAVRMARVLDPNPRCLIVNIPAPTQRWKASVDDRVHGLGEQHRGTAGRKRRGRAGAG